MTHVFHRSLRDRYPVAVAGDGAYLIDRDGKRYLDGSGGAAVSCLGHGHPAVVAAVREQVAKLEFAHTSFMTSEPAEALADDLVAHAPAGLTHCDDPPGAGQVNDRPVTATSSESGWLQSRSTSRPLQASAS